MNHSKLLLEFYFQYFCYKQTKLKGGGVQSDIGGCKGTW